MNMLKYLNSRARNAIGWRMHSYREKINKARETARSQRSLQLLSKSGISFSAHSEIMRQLEPLYSTYTQHVSDKRNATSLEQGGILLLLLEQLKPDVAVDLGSGFSSVVLRTHGERYNCRIISVDDDPSWLNKTKEFLQQQHLNAQELMTWDNFTRSEIRADFLYYDLGTMETRMRRLPDVLSLITDPGVIMVDDVHFPEYRTRIRSELQKNKYACYNLYNVTLDTFGRYAWLAWRK